MSSALVCYNFPVSIHRNSSPVRANSYSASNAGAKWSGATCRRLTSGIADEGRPEGERSDPEGGRPSHTTTSATTRLLKRN